MCQVGSYSDGITHMLRILCFTGGSTLARMATPLFSPCVMQPASEADDTDDRVGNDRRYQPRRCPLAADLFVVPPESSVPRPLTRLPGTIFWKYEPAQLLSLGCSVQTPRALACWRRGFGQCAAAVSQRLHLLPHSCGPLTGGQKA